MKRKSPVLLLLIALGLSSYSVNSTNQTGDVTGGPLSNNTTCTSCHTTTATRPLTIMFATLTGSTTPVTSFIPGQSYTINLSSAQPTILYPKFGYQACALDEDNQNAGTITAATTGSALVPRNGVAYLEHAAAFTTTGNTARIQFNWTAPNTSKDVTFYAIINQVNSNGGVNGDITSHPGELTLTSTVSSSIAEATDLSERISVYPNPATRQVTVALQGKLAAGAQVEIWDVRGRMLRRASLTPKATDNSVAIPVTGLAAGSYFVRVRSGDMQAAKHLAIQ